MVALTLLTASFLVLAAVGSDATAMSRPARVLFLTPISTRSHKNFFMGIANALADRGNQVTLLTAYEPSDIRDNIQEIVLHGIRFQDYIPNAFKGKKAQAAGMTMRAPDMCMKALASEEAQSLLKEEFDVVLISSMYSHCFLSLVHRMKVPYVWVSPAVQLGVTDDWMGNPTFTSFNGFIFVEAKHPLTFYERAISALADTLFTLNYNYFVIPSMDDFCRSEGLCPEDMPSLQEMQHNASLIITNSVRTLEFPSRPSMPNVIPAGGIHCRPSQPLPQDLEEWVQAAGVDGFIFFSLGSAVKSSDMPEKYRQILVKVFGSLKQRVLWKWDQDTMPDLPRNVRLGKWLPQQDILGHPSLCLFITHGGLLSTFESIFHGVPVLGLPVWSDQQTNMIQVVREGWGQVMDWEQLSEEKLVLSINTIIEDQSMKTEARRRSRVMKDQLQPPGDVVSFWVEYVIRHNGAPHLRSPIISMTWYQVYNVDVWLTVVAVLLLVNYLLLKLFLAVYSRCCSSYKDKKKKSV